MRSYIFYGLNIVIREVAVKATIDKQRLCGNKSLIELIMEVQQLAPRLPTHVGKVSLNSTKPRMTTFLLSKR